MKVIYTIIVAIVRHVHHHLFAGKYDTVRLQYYDFFERWLPPTC